MFAVHGLINIVQTSATAVGTVGYTGLETIGIVSSRPSQQNINNERMYRKLRIESQRAAQREERRLVNSNKRNEAQKRKAAKNIKNKEELKKKEALEKTLQQLKPALNNTKLKLSIDEKQKVIVAANEINNFIDKLIELVNNGTTCYQINEFADIVKILEPLLENSNYVLILKKITIFKEAYDNTTKDYLSRGTITKSWGRIPPLESVSEKLQLAIDLCQKIAEICGIKKIYQDKICINSSQIRNFNRNRINNARKQREASEAYHQGRLQQEDPVYRNATMFLR
jgi:RNA processing factor Prp31